MSEARSAAAFPDPGTDAWVEEGIQTAWRELQADGGLLVNVGALKMFLARTGLKIVASEPTGEGQEARELDQAWMLLARMESIEIAHELTAARSDLARMTSALESIRQKLSYAGQDTVSPAVAQSNLNAAYHECVAALKGTSP